MARSEGRLYSRAWDPGSDFRNISRPAQGLYAYLISQADLNQAGLIALRLRKWAAAAKGQTVDDVIRDLDELTEARFVLVDWDTEEVLIRTFIRNDRVYRQPNVMLAAGKEALEIESSSLRAALVAELDRIPLDELSDQASDKKPQSAREVVRGVIENLRLAFADAVRATQENPSPNPSGNPSGRDPGRHNARVPPPPPLPPPHSLLPPWSPNAQRESSVTRENATREPTTPAGQVVAAWTAAMKTSGISPIQDQSTIVGRQARELLDEGNELSLVLEAAVIAAGKGKPYIADAVGPAVKARRETAANTVSPNDPVWGTTLGRSAS